MLSPQLYKEQHFSNVRAPPPRSMGDALHTFGMTLCRDRLGLESCMMRSMLDAFHPSRVIITRIVFHKDCFAVYVTNAGDITIRIVLNRRESRDVSGQDNC
jgi:hypothetical protein